MTKAVRGAIQVREDSRQAIGDAVVRLVTEILRANAIAENHIVSIIFSLTQDLTALNPATGLRQVGFADPPSKTPAGPVGVNGELGVSLFHLYAFAGVLWIAHGVWVKGKVKVRTR